MPLLAFVWALFFSTAGLALAQDNANLLRNAGFEALNDQGWATDWQIWPHTLPEAGAVSIDAGVAHAGGHSLRITHRRATSYSRAQQTIPVEPNTEYLVTGWVKAENVELGEGSQGARLYIEKAGGDTASKRQSGTFGWKQIRVGPLNTKSATKMTIMGYLHRATGTVWYDDLTVVKVTPELRRRMEQERVRRRLEVDLEEARAAAREASDAECEAALTQLATRIAAADLPTELDYRAGPPYLPLHRELFGAMARLNARRLSVPGKMVAWVTDPFAPLPALGLVPLERPLAAEVLMGQQERDQVAVTLCNLGDESLPVGIALTAFPGRRAPRAVLREVFHVEAGAGPGPLVADPLPRLKLAAGRGSLSLPPGLFKQVWVDISSQDSAPGEYRAALELRPAGGPRVTVPLRVRVLPVSFPEQVPVATWNYSYEHWPLIKDRWPQARDDLVAHHTNTYCWPSKYLPWPTFDDQGKLQPLDWTAFDRGVQSHGPIQWLLLWPGFEWQDNLKLRQGLEVGSAEWEHKFVTWFRAVVAGLQQRGFGHDRVAWYLADEPCNAARANAVVAAGQALRKADPQAKIIENPYSAAPRALLEKMDPVVDVWCPELKWAQGDLLEFFRRGSKMLWSYQVLSRGADAFARYRLSFWDCWQKGMTGQGFWDYADCGGSVWNAHDGGRTDYAVVYDGDAEELIPSKRWEAWREGIEDYTYLWMLREAIAAGRGSEADRTAARRLLEERVGKVVAAQTPAALAAARREVLLALVRLHSGE